MAFMIYFQLITPSLWPINSIRVGADLTEHVRGRILIMTTQVSNFILNDRHLCLGMTVVFEHFLVLVIMISDQSNHLFINVNVS